MNSADYSLDYVGIGSLNQTDSGLVTALRTRSDAAFAELHRRYARSLYRRILSITKNHEDAEDVLQETLMRAYLGASSFQGRGSLLSWLTRIAINSSLMILRKRRVRRESGLEPMMFGEDEVPQLDVKDSSPNPEESCLQNERWRRVAKAMDALNPSLRAVMQISIGTEGSMAEIARTLDVSVATVKARLHRARRRLAERTQSKSQSLPCRKRKSHATAPLHCDED